MVKITYKRATLHPMAAHAAQIRKRVGDKAFPTYADAMRKSVRQARENREAGKAREGYFTEEGGKMKYHKPK